MFVTQLNENKRSAFAFVQMSDPQLGMGGYTHDSIALKNAIDQINNLNPSFVVICGDLVDNASVSSFEDFKRIKSNFEVPVYLAAGNHDIENKPTGKSLNCYRTKFGEDYYSFDFVDFRFIVINTQLWKAPIERETEMHDEWFLSTLKSAKKASKSVFIIGHYPLFVERLDEQENYFNLPIKKRFELLSLYKEFGVIAHLGGHAHKAFEHKIENIQFVNSETTSLNFDNRPLGFRLWSVNGKNISNKFIELAKIPSKEIRLFNDENVLTKNTGTR